MAEVEQMADAKFGGMHMIEDDVRHTRDLRVARYIYERQIGPRMHRRVDRDHSLDLPFDQQPRYLFDKVGTMQMAGGEVKESGGCEYRFHPVKNHRRVAVA